MVRFWKVSTCAGLLVFLQSAYAADLKSNIFVAPSLETRQAIETLIPEKKSGELTWKELKVDPDKLPPQQTPATVDAQGKVDVPFAAQNSMILQFKPDTTQKQVNDYLGQHNYEVIRTFPGIGAVQVKTDLSRFFQQQGTDNSINDTIIRGLVQASQEFKKDPRILEATPDVVMQGQADITNFVMPTEVQDQAPVGDNVTDWGIRDIQADQLWALPGAQDGVIFGIMDVGFAKHEDLVFLGYSKDMPIEDHGTHVAGIACGRHPTSSGVRGVLPNCFVRAQYGNVFFKSVQGGQVTQFVTLFSQILGSLSDFVESTDDVSTFNISLGYNWEGNFGINPDAADATLSRSLVEIQGPMLVTVLRNAEKRGKIIFSAAGNDSTGIDPPIGAKYASPFNWAAIVARGQGINNGVIVEAHDKDGKRAPFSNTGGDISCPGVDIVSTVAFDGQHHTSTSAYGKMSGTSMASPYCAAGLALFRLVRPSYSSEEAMACLLKSNTKSSSNVPMLRLKDALGACP
ncbi:S8 family peptidase [Mesorhizobium sp. ORM8.1]